MPQSPTFVTPTLGRRPMLLVAALMLGLLAGLSAASPARADIRLAVDADRELRVGETGCFDLEVTNSRGNRVNNARVRFAGKRARTTERGRAHLCAKLRWPGEHAFFAFKGDQRDRAIVEAGGRSTGLGGDHWYAVEAQLPAAPLPSDGSGAGCSAGPARKLAVFGIDRGECASVPNLDVPTVFFPNTRARPNLVTAKWEAGGESSPVQMEFSDRYRDAVRGYLPSRGSGHFYVTDAASNGPGCRSFTGGSAPARAGEPGGPLQISVTARTTFGTLTGYTFHIRGALFGIDCDND